MLQDFLRKFNMTEQITPEEDKLFYKDLPSEFYSLIDLLGGTAFDNGLYRVHSFKSSVNWSLLIADFFNDYSNRIYPFGYDWMGRQFCLKSSGEILLMFDPATGQVFELKQSIISLHNKDFAEDKDGMLALNLFCELRLKNDRISIKYSECFGYKIPPFFGGNDEPDNFEVIDMEVYWHIQNQLYNKTKRLPNGTNIRSVRLDS